jgi:hypothetical protein
MQGHGQTKKASVLAGFGRTYGGVKRMVLADFYAVNGRRRALKSKKASGWAGFGRNCRTAKT